MNIVADTLVEGAAALRRAVISNSVIVHDNSFPAPLWLASQLEAKSLRSKVFTIDQLFISAGSTKNSVVFILFDMLVAHSRSLDIIKAFRRNHPSVPVVLMSNCISSSDFSLERLPFCDVLLRSDVGIDTVFQAIEIAVGNNTEWRKRLKALGGQDSFAEQIED
jgi:hypothetical protein